MNDTKLEFEKALFEVLSGGLSDDEVKLAKAAVVVEGNKWVGSQDWIGASSAVVAAALKAVADRRALDTRRQI